MNIAREYRAIEAALAIYREQLDVIPDEVFAETPADGSWSFSEVYSHIMKASLGSLIAMERCSNSNCPPTNKGLSLQGHFVLTFGCFPPVRVRTPDGTEGNKITEEEARNLLIKFRQRIEKAMPMVANAPDKVRYAHPNLGMLNAKEWFKFTRIHLQHHLKQLERIKKKFSLPT